ncbi:isopenicillin N synthase family dioxygenase [Klebsiella pneumoniae]|uniref:isopenicillin N synthase family dioxygenase n=1 Tax=Klebsiella pneumoniae TaxID=573 RepID=UPI000E2BEE6A|nr:2-oxoglutarate and iron-dependent oxygenase domain-containing protein [Klebsiella pneumoniae]MCL9964844.1 isopenicillin N synthase family oxygenase [Klebsiella pneumoniae]SYT41235.1 2-Oxobutyrate oxidase, putative [Klebsiella pneumoniae]HBZ8272997.1 isopenicillin N synthase family oxygenase [Klebsiella pneumoniae]HBZ8287360.1 isopenicillin N synthase family oxygenase [Klebsiella pneumoniae]HBZ8330132.1 isopenicillin N synthase family oxygenase [Klebsiella pneumoniae]
MTAVKHAFTELPTIDIRDLAGDDLARRQAVADAIGRAAREVGFFYITGHGIDPALIAGVREAAKQIFALPMEEKMNYYIGHSKSHKGYVPEGEEIYGSGKPDHKEAFDIGFQAADDHPLVLAGTPPIGANEWPDLPDFRARVLAYYDAVFALGHRLFDAFALALGLPEGYFKPMVTCPPAKLRLIHYPFDASVEDVPGIGAHTDYECFTLLLADQPGLEVLNEESVWIDAPPVKNAAGEEAFVINIGDMLEVLSAGTFVATAHRVRKVPQERYSFPLFFACDYHTLIRPLPTFLAAGEAGEYQELSIGEHMWSQALQTYRYLREKVNRGELQLPERARGTNTFGHLKKQAQQKKP